MCFRSITFVHAKQCKLFCIDFFFHGWMCLPRRLWRWMQFRLYILPENSYFYKLNLMICPP